MYLAITAIKDLYQTPTEENIAKIVVSYLNFFKDVRVRET